MLKIWKWYILIDLGGFLFLFICLFLRLFHYVTHAGFKAEIPPASIHQVSAGIPYQHQEAWQRPETFKMAPCRVLLGTVWVKITLTGIWIPNPQVWKTRRLSSAARQNQQAFAPEVTIWVPYTMFPRKFDFLGFEPNTCLQDLARCHLQGNGHRFSPRSLAASLFHYALRGRTSSPIRAHKPGELKASKTWMKALCLSSCARKFQETVCEHVKLEIGKDPKRNIPILILPPFPLSSISPPSSPSLSIMCPYGCLLWVMLWFRQNLPELLSPPTPHPPRPGMTCPEGR